MAKKIKWVGTLSTTRRNNVDLIQVRQNNVNSEVLGFNIVDDNGEPYDLKNRKVLFCTYFDKFAPVEQYAEVIENGKIVYTMNQHDMQKPVRINFAYFKILDEKDNLVDTTQNFSYNIMSSIESKCMNSEPYIVRLEEVLDAFLQINTDAKKELEQIIIDFNQQVIEQQQNFEIWFESIKEILESIDPGGVILNELVDFRYSKMLDKHFSRMKERGDFWDDTFLSSSVKVIWFGAVGDGVTDDSDKIKNAIKYAEKVNKPLEFESNRTYIINEPIIIRKGIALKGINTTIKVKDNSDLFHNTLRTENVKDLNFPNLFYDFHSVLLYIDSNVDISGITIDGNAQNQWDDIDGVKWNYVTPNLSDKSRNYYKYFHGVQVYIPTKDKISINITGCEIKYCTWNDIVIGNRNGENRPKITGKISNNIFKSSSNDLLSLHRFNGDLQVKNNKFINPAQHSTHCYYDVSGVLLESNEYRIESNRYTFYPVKYDEIYHCVLGHHYNSIVENIIVRNNLFINKQEEASIVDIFTLAILNDIDISENRSLGSNIGINISYPILGQFKVDKNTFHSKNTGLQIRLFNSEGKFNYLGDLAQEPYNTNGIFSDNIFTFSNESGYSIDIRDTKNAEKIDKSRMSMFLIQLRYNTAIRNNYIFSDSAIQIRTEEIVNYRPNILNNLQYLELDSKGALKNFIGRGNTNEFTGYVLSSGNFVDTDGKSKKTKIANIQSNNPNYTTNQIVATEEVKIGENSILSFACGADKGYIIRVNIDDLNGNLIKTINLGMNTPINEFKMVTIPISLKGEQLGVRTKISIFFISENDVISSLNLGAIKLENVLNEFEVNASTRY